MDVKNVLEKATILNRMKPRVLHNAQNQQMRELISAN